MAKWTRTRTCKFDGSFRSRSHASLNESARPLHQRPLRLQISANLVLYPVHPSMNNKGSHLTVESLNKNLNQPLLALKASTAASTRPGAITEAATRDLGA